MCGDVVKKEPFVAVICGVKNSGKTTLITRLVRLLSEKGIRTAVIKHDGHDFECDIPGTDSYRIREAGAYGTAVFSKYRSFVYKEGCRETPEEMIAQFESPNTFYTICASTPSSGVQADLAMVYPVSTNGIDIQSVLFFFFSDNKLQQIL